jgi:hypothetical protein
MGNFIREEIIRKMARDNKWQTFYSRSKDISSFSLFNNVTKLTKIQLIFLQYLEIYNILYGNLREKEKYLNEEVIDNDVRCDAYLYYRKITGNKKDKESDKEENNSNIPSLTF